MDNKTLVDQIQANLSTSHDSDFDKLLAVLTGIKDHRPKWNWLGIYLLIDETLVLGPFLGKPTDHTQIAVGVGVCGSAVKDNTNKVIEDVREVENYLACTTETRAELVVLIRHGERVVGQFDIDSDTVGAFDREDEALLDALAPLVAQSVAHLISDYKSRQNSSTHHAVKHS